MKMRSVQDTFRAVVPQRRRTDGANPQEEQTNLQEQQLNPQEQQTAQSNRRALDPERFARLSFDPTYSEHVIQKLSRQTEANHSQHSRRDTHPSSERERRSRRQRLRVRIQQLQQSRIPQRDNMPPVLNQPGFLDPSSAEPLRDSAAKAKQEEQTVRQRLRSIGAKYPPFELLDFIGKGTYGRVYKA